MADSDRLRLGTRGSKLALAQATSVKSQLEAANQGLTVEIVPIKTSGDHGNREVLGAFVREIEQALLENKIDLALHCLKDLPTQPTAGLVFASHLERDDPRDALITAELGFANLPAGAVVGTGSSRRTSQLRSVRTDLVFRPLVGNVDTRMRKLMGGEYQAIVLALAGFNRLGLSGSLSSVYPGLNLIPFSFDEVLPAPGQAVLVIQVREGDVTALSAASSLDHAETRQCAEAEREFLKSFGGGCAVPVAAHCLAIDGQLHLRGLVSSPDGKRRVEGRASGADSIALGRSLGDELLAKGAGDLFQAVAR